MKNAHVKVERDSSIAAMEKFEYFGDWRKANFPELSYYTKLYGSSKNDNYDPINTYYVISSNPVIVYDEEDKKAYSYNDGNWDIFDEDLIDD